MFCGKCGNQLYDTSKFCPKCGQPTSNNVDPTSKNLHSTNTYKKVGAITLVAIIAIIGIIFFSFRSTTNSSSQSVAKAFFKSISTEDSALFKKCLLPSDLDKSKKEAKNEKQTFDVLVKTALSTFNETFKSELGKDWLDKIELSVTENPKDKDKFIVTFSIKGLPNSKSSLDVVKKNGNYYISGVDAIKEW